MKDIKLDQIQPVGGRTRPDRAQAPGKKPAGDFGKALEQVQAGTRAKPDAGLLERTRAVIENFQKDEAQFNELMKVSQHQAKLIQSMMSRKPEKES